MLAEINAMQILSKQIIGDASSYDRGMADSYYGRAVSPHKLVNGIEVPVLAGSAEHAEYMKGYEYNEELGNFKDWGNP